MTSVQSYMSRDRLIKVIERWLVKAPLISERSLDQLKLFDALSPGWRRVRITMFDVERSDGSSGIDVLYELPGGVALRGRDMTGVITRRYIPTDEYALACWIASAATTYTVSDDQVDGYAEIWSDYYPGNNKRYAKRIDPDNFYATGGSSGVLPGDLDDGR